MLTLGQDLEKDSLAKELCLSLWSTLSVTDLVELQAESNTDLIRLTYLVHKTRLSQEIRHRVERRFFQSCSEGERDWDFSKSKTRALSVKVTGNSAFGNGRNEEALELYSQAIAWMPVNETTELSVLYANRSAALFHLDMPTSAQQDIETAFKLGYPPELHYKLHERLGRCFLREGKKAEAGRRFQQALKALAHPSISLQPDKLEKVKLGLEQLVKATSGTGFGFALNGNLETSIANKPQALPTIAAGRGRPYKNASTKLSVQFNETEGRHVIATQTIQPGEVILVEKAYVSAMTPEAYHQQCFQCYEMLWASVPCSNCALVSFCSIRCRDLAWKTHHKHECGILGILRSAGISITCLMALRVLTQSGLTEVLKWTEDELHLSNGNTGGILDTGIPKLPPVAPKHQPIEDYRADHISAAMALVTHAQGRSVEDLFQRVCMAFFLLSLLKKTSFFSEGAEAGSESGAGGKRKDVRNDETKDAKDETSHEEQRDILLGTILLRLLQLLQFNAHEIAGWDGGLAKSAFIGGGLFPTLAFFNHSCNPAIVRYFVNDTVVVRTVRTLLKGEPVTENYGPIFTQSPREERQAYLRDRYRFSCNCVACQDDWPLFQNLSRTTLSFRCTNCRSFLCNTSAESMGLFLRCSRCLKPTNILKSLKTLENSEGKFNQAMEFLSKGRVDTAAGMLLENMLLFDSILLPPFPDYHWCQEGLRKCYLPMGNKSRAARLGSGAEEAENMLGPIVG